MVSFLGRCYSPAVERVMISWPARAIYGIAALGGVVGFYILKDASLQVQQNNGHYCTNSTASCQPEGTRAALLSLAALGSMVAAASLASMAIAIRKCCKRCREGIPPAESPRIIVLQYGTSQEESL